MQVGEETNKQTVDIIYYLLLVGFTTVLLTLSTFQLKINYFLWILFKIHPQIFICRDIKGYLQNIILDRKAKISSELLIGFSLGIGYGTHKIKRYLKLQRAVALNRLNFHFKFYFNSRYFLIDGRGISGCSVYFQKREYLLCTISYQVTDRVSCVPYLIR